MLHLEVQILQMHFETSNQWLQQHSLHEQRTEIQLLTLSAIPSHFGEQNEKLANCKLQVNAKLIGWGLEDVRLDNHSVSSQVLKATSPTNAAPILFSCQENKAD